MTTELTYEQRARKIADDAIALLQDHERRQHGGERCTKELVNLLAFLAHALGAHVSTDTPAVIAAFVERVRDYGAIHGEHHA